MGEVQDVRTAIGVEVEGWVGGASWEVGTHQDVPGLGNSNE